MKTRGLNPRDKIATVIVVSELRKKSSNTNNGIMDYN